MPVDRLCLIYAGKILREPGTLQKYGVEDGGTVHMVVKNPRPVCIILTQLISAKTLAKYPQCRVVMAMARAGND